MQNLEDVSYSLVIDKTQHERWLWGNKGNHTADMKILLCVVGEALDLGVFYTSEFFDYVDGRLGRFLTEDQRNHNIDRVERGFWGMEIYYARKHEEAVRAQEKEKADFELAQRIPTGTVYKNVSLCLGDKKYNFAKLVLVAFLIDDCSMQFHGTRRGVKGYSILTLSVSSFFHSVTDRLQISSLVEPLVILRSVPQATATGETFSLF